MNATDLLAAAQAQAARPEAQGRKAAAAEADDRPRNEAGQLIPAAEAEAAEAARIGAAARRKAEAREAAEAADMMAAAEAGRRSYLAGTDPGRYSAAELADLAAAAVNKAAAGAVAKAGRRGRLSDGDREALTAEAVTLILAAQAEAATGAEAADSAQAAEAVAMGRGRQALAPIKDGAAEARAEAVARGQAPAADAGPRMPRRGGLVNLAPEARRAAIAAEAGAVTKDGLNKADLLALTVLLGRLILTAGPQPWRDTARMGREAPRSLDAIADAEAADADDLAVSGRDLLALADDSAQAPLRAAENRRPDDPRAARRPPLTAEAEAAAYLATGRRTRERMALRAALARNRASSDDLAAVYGRASAGAVDKAASIGRRDLARRLAGPDGPALALALADLAEAEDGTRDGTRRRAAAEAADLARLAPAPDSAHAARGRRILTAAYPDGLAARLARCYRDPNRPRPDDLAAAWRNLAAALAAIGTAAPTPCTDPPADRAAAVAATVAARWDGLAQARRRVAALAREARKAPALAAEAQGPTVRPTDDLAQALAAAAEDRGLTAADRWADLAPGRRARAVTARPPRPTTPAAVRAADRAAQAREAQAVRTAEAQAATTARLAAMAAEAAAIREAFGLAAPAA